MFECVEKACPGKIRVIAFAAPGGTAEEHVRAGFRGEVIELRAPAARSVFCQDSRKIRGLFRQHEQLRVIVEQSGQQRGAGFGLAGDKAGALLKRQRG